MSNVIQAAHRFRRTEFRVGQKVRHRTYRWPAEIEAIDFHQGRALYLVTIKGISFWVADFEIVAEKLTTTKEGN